MTTPSPHLIRLAKISMPNYAKRVLDCETALLAKLRLLVPYANTMIPGIPRRKFNAILAPVNVSCPYCTTSKDDCSDCLFTLCPPDAVDPSRAPCVDTPFGGITQHDIEMHTSCCVYHNLHCAGILLGHGKLLKSELRACVSFERARIAWAKLPCWGEENVHRESTDPFGDIVV